MAEETESVRKDSAKRQIEERQIIDWSGKRIILPKGTTLPALGSGVTYIDGEVFVLVKPSGVNQLYEFDESVNNWITVGP